MKKRHSAYEKTNATFLFSAEVAIGPASMLISVDLVEVESKNYGLPVIGREGKQNEEKRK